MMKTINFGGSLISLAKPLLMGIINVSPDSFYKGSRKTGIDEILFQTEDMLENGAAIIDIGAMSSKPGADIISLEDELKRIIGPIKAIMDRFPDLIFSVDTIRSQVAREAIECGVSCINDISGGNFDSEIMNVVANYQVPYIIMHMQGLPADMQINPKYSDLVMEIMSFFTDKIRQARQAGINDIIIDPGFGFGKTIDHNYEIMHQFDVFQIFDIPLLAGVSRKSMIWKVLGSDADHALNGTTALNMYLLTKGAKILRVHDVKEAAECIRLFELINSSDG